MPAKSLSSVVSLMSPGLEKCLLPLPLGTAESPVLAVLPFFAGLLVSLGIATVR